MIKTVIFDLDGVIVSTDECHYLAWKRVADEENIRFDRQINRRLRGISRLESLEIVLESATKTYSAAEKQLLAERKNGYYREAIKSLSPADILPGVMGLLTDLRSTGIKLAIGSSSRNSPEILARIGLDKYFDATADGNEIIKSKPDPEVFLLAAKKLNTDPEDCAVIEDAEAGVIAARKSGMKAVGVGDARDSKNANLTVKDMTELSLKKLRQLWEA